MTTDSAAPILPALTANERGADRGWPDAANPGAPLNPKQEGWHWLRHKGGNDPSPWHWTDEDAMEGEFSWATDDAPYDEDDAAKYFSYLGPCLTPAQHAAEITAAVQAERKACAQIAIKQLGSEVFGTASRIYDAILARGAADAPACQHCMGSEIEEVYGGHGTVLEVPCNYCQPTPDAPSSSAPLDCDVCNGDCASANPPVGFCPIRDGRP